MRKRERAGSPRSGLFPRLSLAALTVLVAGAARAQVMEIGDDGSVTTYSGPTQFLSSGARPLTATPAARRGGADPSPAVARAIDEASARHQLDPRLAEAVAWRESGFDPAAVSPKGARGVMQLMPATAQALGVDASDTAGNIDGGVGYLSRMIRRFGGDLAKALAAYDAGPAAVERYGGVPPYAETVAYVGAVLARMNRTGAATPTAR